MGWITPQLHEVLAFERDSGDGLRIGLDDYPIFDDEYRDGLNRKIIARYTNREIGLETIPEFTHQLRWKMHEIMPYFNQLYRSELVQFNALDTVGITTTRDDTSTDTGSSNATGDTTVTSKSGARNVNSDTPQTMLSGDEDYATAATDANATAQSDTDANQSSTSSSVGKLLGNTKTTGFQGPASELLMRFRATFLNIDVMVLTELNELFMSVLSNGAEIFPRPLPGAGLYGELPRLDIY